MRIAQYTILLQNDLMVILADDLVADLPSVTDTANDVIQDLVTRTGGLGSRRVFYRDSVGRFDEIRHSDGQFTKFAPCTPGQQNSFRDMTCVGCGENQ